MARIDLIECDNCGAEFSASPEALASMTQLVVTQGGSRSHVYELCPSCAAGLTRTLPDDIADWPRFVAREAVQRWLGSRQAREGIPARANGPSRRETETLTTAEKEAREAAGDFGHVWRPTEYGDGLETERES